MTQADALELMMAGSNVFLTGAPGAGKTYVLNHIYRKPKTQVNESL
jgi:predicted ATPase